MEIFLSVIKVVAILIATAIIGNWFLAEVRRAKQNGTPIFKVYLSVPGLLILLILSLPLILWILK